MQGTSSTTGYKKIINKTEKCPNGEKSKDKQKCSERNQKSGKKQQKKLSTITKISMSEKYWAMDLKKVSCNDDDEAS